MKRFVLKTSGLLAVLVIVLCGCKKPTEIWYVQPEYEKAWNLVLQKTIAPRYFSTSVQLWGKDTPPPESGIFITSRFGQNQGRIQVYYRLSDKQEYQGARVLAVDPWMIFSRQTNPGLSVDRAVSDKGGDGVLLIPGIDLAAVNAWTARLIQESPGVFSIGDNAWRQSRSTLFKGSRFPREAESYSWQDVLLRLMGNERVWVYAPLSVIRSYPNFQKTILDVSAFPEEAENNEYSLHADILWAVPSGADKKNDKQLAQTLDWLGKYETQTIIADVLGWIPADPGGLPLDSVSVESHRNWLGASYIYTVNE